jgi:hypothetical protein
LRYRFLILDAYQLDIYIYVSKDVRIRGYFSKAKGVREQTNMEDTGIENSPSSSRPVPRDDIFVYLDLPCLLTHLNRVCSFSPYF